MNAESRRNDTMTVKIVRKSCAIATERNEMSVKESIALHLECMDEVQDERFLRQILTLLLKYEK